MAGTRRVRRYARIRQAETVCSCFCMRAHLVNAAPWVHSWTDRMCPKVHAMLSPRHATHRGPVVRCRCSWRYESHEIVLSSVRFLPTAPDAIEACQAKMGSDMPMSSGQVRRTSCTDLADFTLPSPVAELKKCTRVYRRCSLSRAYTAELQTLLHRIENFLRSGFNAHVSPRSPLASELRLSASLIRSA